MEDTLAIILAGGRGERLGILGRERTKPAIPFAGKYRIIDFTLSNCVNSGITQIYVLTQYQPLSLIDHIGIGTSWGLARVDGTGLRLLQPYLSPDDRRDWYKGTADAVFQNLPHIERQGVKRVLVLSGDHVYRMDYSEMVKFHEQVQADVTLATIPMPFEELARFGTVTVDDAGKTLDFQEKVKKPDSNLVSMGIYLFNTEILYKYLEEDAELRSSKHDFGKNVLPRLIAENGKTYAYNFRGYWRDVGTMSTYWEANMDLLDMYSELLYDEYWPIRTKEELRPPAVVTSSGDIVRSMVSCGCVIEGRVEHSVLSPGVRVAEGAVVKDSIIMADSVIGPHSIIDYSILDKEVTVGAGCHIGYGDNFQISKKEPRVMNTGITVIGKRAQVPPGVRIGRNCLVHNNVIEEDFSGPEIQSGETIIRSRRGRSSRSA